jgi:hypothetical protein
VITRSLQHIQPERIISGLLLALENSSSGSGSIPDRQLATISVPSAKDFEAFQSLPGIYPKNASQAQRLSEPQSSLAIFKIYNFPNSFKFGLAGLTGTIEVGLLATADGKATQSRRKQDQSEQPVLTVEIRVPTWLCYRALQSTIYQCQRGWMHYFRIRTVYPSSSPRWKLLVEIIKRDDVDSLQRELQGTDWSPEDCDDSGFWNLMSVSLINILGRVMTASLLIFLGNVVPLQLESG